VLQGIARLAIVAPRRIIGLALLVMVAAGIFGLPVTRTLSAGGFNDPSSQSAKAAALLADKFHQSDTDLIITVTSEGGVHSAAAQAVAGQVVAVLKESPYVADLSSAWTAPPATANALVSTDGKTGLVVAGIVGGENEYPKRARELADRLPSDRDGVTVRAGGALTYAEANEQSERDLLLMESIAIPVSFVVLVWVFGGLLAAALPMIVGVFAILGSLAVLRAVTFVTDVSIFAMNLTAAMGLALAVDYTLLILNRFRDELAGGGDRDEAMVRTMTTAGRTVLSRR
jgi:RND superfamily putative drug exporter